MFSVTCSRLRVAWVLGVSMLALLAPSRSEAASVPFVIDLSFPFDPVAGSPFAIRGTFLEAGRFEVDSSLLPAGTINFVPLNRLDAFSLMLPVLSLSPGEVAASRCGTDPTGFQFPCGILFVGMDPLTLVGGFNVTSATGAFDVSFGNTSPSRFDPALQFQSVGIFDSNPNVSVIVASGVATIRAPIPEPSSLLLLLTGGLVVRRTALSRRRNRGPSAPH